MQCNRYTFQLERHDVIIAENACHKYKKPCYNNSTIFPWSGLEKVQKEWRFWMNKTLTNLLLLPTELAQTYSAPST